MIHAGKILIKIIKRKNKVINITIINNTLFTNRIVRMKKVKEMIQWFQSDTLLMRKKAKGKLTMKLLQPTSSHLILISLNQKFNSYTNKILTKQRANQLLTMKSLCLTSRTRTQVKSLLDVLPTGKHLRPLTSQ